MQKAQAIASLYNSTSTKDLKFSKNSDDPYMDPDGSLKKNKSTGNVQAKLENIEAR